MDFLKGRLRLTWTWRRCALFKVEDKTGILKVSLVIDGSVQPASMCHLPSQELYGDRGQWIYALSGKGR
jgi:hypothetical protein